MQSFNVPNVINHSKYLMFGKYHGTLDDKIKVRDTKFRQAIALLNGILWDRYILKKNKKYIYNTIVKSIITYGSEVWQVKIRSEKTLQVTEMTYWRRAARKSRLERFTNERIGEIMEVTHTVIDESQNKF